MLPTKMLRTPLVLWSVLVIINGCAPATTPTPVPPATLPPTTSSPTPAGMPKGPGAQWHLVVISESSGWGVGQAFASQIEKDVPVKVVVDNFAIGDLSAGAVLQALQTGKAPISRLEQLPAALKEADVVVMFGNPMDSVDSETGESINRCFASIPPASLTPQAFDKYTADLKAIWAKIFELRSGQPTILRAIDVANPFVSSWKKNQVFDACTVYWEGVSTAVRQAAEAYHIPFLSCYDAFNGVKHDQDAGQKGYIGSDGIHPNDLANQLTAELLSKLGYEPVPPPQK
jgi:lysophospholipase L1-like esterase